MTGAPAAVTEFAPPPGDALPAAAPNMDAALELSPMPSAATAVERR
jgi:hypothetical protein